MALTPQTLEIVSQIPRSAAIEQTLPSQFPSVFENFRGDDELARCCLRPVP